MFALHPQLAHDTFPIVDLALCSVLLMNNRLFPWVILVPQRKNIKEIIELSESDRHLLMDEISQISYAMQTVFLPDKLNVAALGNQVPQLHIHIIARFAADPAWPTPVWGQGQENYADPQPVITQLKQQLFPA